MRTRSLHVLLLALVVAGAPSCSTMGLVASSDPQPAARAGLRPDLRIFYDSLEGQGDWILIEPYGWVFRPDINVAAWRPYEDGFWTWNDWYGWVWVSEEPFGWATYHYGRWFFDDYQGWVWVPSSDWGPAWVAWARSGDYLGWAPLPAGAPDDFGSTHPQGTPPLHGWSFVTAGDLVGTQLSGRLANAERTRELLSAATPVVQLKEREGRTVNLGPPVEWVERVGGAAVPRTEVRDPLDAGSPRGAKPRAEGPHPVEQARRAGEEAARKAERLSESRAPAPAVVELPRLRAPAAPARAKGSAKATGAKAPPTMADTLRPAPAPPDK